MITRSKKHRKKATKRADLSSMREALKDGRVWVSLGTVTGGSDYYQIDGADILVEVELHPSTARITAKLGTVAGAMGAGVWAIPPLGSEVIVAVPDGEMIFQPTIVALLPSGSLPDGISPTTLVVACPAGGNVLIHDGSGTAHQLVTKEAYEAHKHPTGVGPSGIADNATVPSSYTAVLKGK
jgi:hypothetical protein